MSFYFQYSWPICYTIYLPIRAGFFAIKASNAVCVYMCMHVCSLMRYSKRIEQCPIRSLQFFICTNPSRFVKIRTYNFMKHLLIWAHESIIILWSAIYKDLCRALQIIRIEKEKRYYNCISIFNIWCCIVCAERGGRFYLFIFFSYIYNCNQYTLKTDTINLWYSTSELFMIYAFLPISSWDNVYHLSLIF